MLKTLPLHLKQTVTDLKAFLKNPSDNPDTETGTPGKVKVFFSVLLIDVAISLVLAGVIGLVEKTGWYSTDNHAVAEMMRTMPVWTFLLVGVILLPLLEEYVFRYGLRFKKRYLVFFFTAILLLVAAFAYSVLPLWWALAAMVALGTLLALLLLNSSAIVSRFLKQSWARIYKVVFYTMALLFGLVHLTNFEYSLAILILAPVLVAPQIVAGLLFGYMRVKHGFFWGYFLHAGHNAIFLTLGVLYLGEVEEKLNISNDNYSLKVEEYMRMPSVKNNSTTLMYTAKDSVGFENKKLDEVISHLLKKEQVSVQFGEKAKLNRTINLSYKRYAADSAESSQNILGELQKLYNFEVTTANFEREVWYLEIEDSSMLASHTAPEEGLLKTVVSSKAITLENVTLNDLLETIGKAYNVTFVNKAESSSKYNFEFEKSDFEQLKQELKSKYGLVVQGQKVLAERALVEFR
ncbi:hypothetical protein ACFSRY_04060 [Pontibacter locisalis]|uniref:CAAX protease self-immunity n=1 Tax=Pontibacter locisalis TaxID=1719035 RepID=A0ABW5IJ67_9BACT